MGFGLGERSPLVLERVAAVVEVHTNRVLELTAGQNGPGVRRDEPYRGFRQPGEILPALVLRSPELREVVNRNKVLVTVSKGRANHRGAEIRTDFEVDLSGKHVTGCEVKDCQLVL